MRILACIILLVTLGSAAQGQEIVFAATDIARTLTLEMREEGKRSIAVSTFRNLQGEVTSIGAFFAEELFNQLVASRGDNVVVVERSRTDAIFDEQRLGIDGLRESGKLDAFVRILEVDALVVGTISTIPELEGRLRISARLIAVPSGEALASASAFARVEAIPEDLPPVKETLASDVNPSASYELKGVVYELIRCSKETRLILCHFVVTNNGADKNLSVYVTSGNTSHLYDQRGHLFRSTRITFADVDVSSSYAKKRLITEIPTSLKIYFEGVPSTIEFIKVLHVDTSDGDFELRNVRFAN